MKVFLVIFFLVTFQLYLLPVRSFVEQEQCEIHPSHHIIHDFVQLGENFTGFCHTAVKYSTPADEFRLKDGNGTVLAISQSYVNSSLKMETKFSLIGPYSLSCFRGDQAVCLITLRVYTLPKKLDNLSCFLFDNYELRCHFKLPSNGIATNYTLFNTFHDLQSACGGTFVSDPPRPSEDNRENYQHCAVKTLDIFDNDIVLKTVGINMFGSNSFQKSFARSAILKSDTPELKLQFLSDTSANLSVEVNSHFYTIQSNFTARVSLKSEWSSIVPPPPQPLYHVTTSVSQPPRQTVSAGLTGLSPFTNYSVNVSVVCLPEGNANGDSGCLESPVANLKFRTASSKPLAAPTVPAGSFFSCCTNSSLDVTILWQDIPAYQRGGANFSYCVAGGPGDTCRVQVDYSSVRLRCPSLSDTWLMLNVTSCNTLGHSPAVSVLVPPVSQRLPLPHPLLVVEVATTVYRVLWRSVSSASSFTLLWCRARGGVSEVCNRVLGWREVNWLGEGRLIEANVTVTGVTDNVSPVFAVAAIGGSSTTTTSGSSSIISSSGLVWFNCYAGRDPMPGILHHLQAENITSTSVTLQWTASDCYSSLLLTTFSVQIREVGDGDGGGGEGDGEFASVKWHRVTEQPNLLLIRGLRALTAYEVRVAAQIGPALGDYKSVQFETTFPLPSPPSPPTISHLTNTSVVLSWCPSAHEQHVTHFIVDVECASCARRQLCACQPRRERVNTTIATREHQQRQEGHATLANTVTLTDLQPFTVYSAVLNACNPIFCSAASTRVTWTTAPGVPGVPRALSAQLLNATHAQLTWQSPLPRGSRLSSYRLLLQPVHLGANNKSQLITLNVSASGGAGGADGGGESSAENITALVHVPLCNSHLHPHSDSTLYVLEMAAVTVLTKTTATLSHLTPTSEQNNPLSHSNSCSSPQQQLQQQLLQWEEQQLQGEQQLELWGPWSLRVKLPCQLVPTMSWWFGGGGRLALVLAGTMALVIVASVAAAALCRRVHRKWHQLKDVRVSLPPGLSILNTPLISYDPRAGVVSGHVLNSTDHRLHPRPGHSLTVRPPPLPPPVLNKDTARQTVSLQPLDSHAVTTPPATAPTPPPTATTHLTSPQSMPPSLAVSGGGGVNSPVLHRPGAECSRVDGAVSPSHSHCVSPTGYSYAVCTATAAAAGGAVTTAAAAVQPGTETAPGAGDSGAVKPGADCQQKPILAPYINATVLSAMMSKMDQCGPKRSSAGGPPVPVTEPCGAYVTRSETGSLQPPVSQSHFTTPTLSLSSRSSSSPSATATPAIATPATATAAGSGYVPLSSVVASGILSTSSPLK